MEMALRIFVYSGIRSGKLRFEQDMRYLQSRCSLRSSASAQEENSGKGDEDQALANIRVLPDVIDRVKWRTQLEPRDREKEGSKSKR